SGHRPAPHAQPPAVAYPPDEPSSTPIPMGYSRFPSWRSDGSFATSSSSGARKNTIYRGYGAQSSVQVIRPCHRPFSSCLGWGLPLLTALHCLHGYQGGRVEEVQKEGVTASNHRLR